MMWWRMLKRDWQSGHLNVLLMALLVAVTTHATIGFLSSRIQNSMLVQASALLGGDLVIRSPDAIDPQWLAAAEQRNLRHAQTLEFSSVVMAGDAMQLSAVKAVSDEYPLKTPLKISDTPFAPEQPVSHGPNPGKLWVEQRLLTALNINVGDSVDVGDVTLTVEKVLVFEPDRSGNFYSFVPRALMHWDDIAATGVIQPGSRLDYYVQFAGEPAAIRNLQTFLTPLLQPGQSFLSVHSQQRSISSALQRAEGYLQLASLMAILLAAVAIAMGAHFFSRQHFDTAALLRCFGLSSRQILQLFIIQLIALALVTGLLGSALGWALHFIAVKMLGELLPQDTPLPSLVPLFTGTALALVILPGFALPSLAQLQRTPPLRVLRRDLAPQPLSQTASYASAAILVALLMLWYARDPVLIAALFVGALVAWLVASLLTQFFMRLLLIVSRYSPLSVQAGLRNLARRRDGTRIQLLGFGLTGMAMLMVILVRTELIGTWENQLPEQAPNHFVLNVLPEQSAAFTQFLHDNQVVSQPLYPVVRGRLTHINQQAVTQSVSKETSQDNERDAPEALNRELNLTFAADLPSDNRVLAGSWWNDPERADSNEKQVSIEQRLAEKLRVTVGDSLTLFVANQTFTARVTSIRSVKWESFQPNFYLIFRPGDLDGMPTTFLTSFYLNAKQKILLRDLVHRFPAISVLEVDAILARVKGILAQVSAAVEFILLFVLAAGLTITLATLITTMPERYREGALMRTLGATGRQLRLQQWSEFFAIGFLAGIVAAGGCELARFGVYWKIFSLPYTPALWIWIIMPPLFGVLIGLAGHWSSRKILGQSPLILLRES